MAEEYENIITLTDAEGLEVDLEILDIVPYEDAEYAVLLPLENDDDEAVILEILPSGDDDDGDTLQGVEDEAVLKSVYALFKERNKDDFDFSSDE